MRRRPARPQNRHQRRRFNQRYERERAKQPPRPKRGILGRLGMAAAGVLMVAGGIALLVGGTGGNRIFRVEGILIVVGAVLVVAGALGW